jgi:hypothetical protein
MQCVVWRADARGLDQHKCAKSELVEERLLGGRSSKSVRSSVTESAVCRCLSASWTRDDLGALFVVQPTMTRFSCARLFHRSHLSIATVDPAVGAYRSFATQRPNRFTVCFNRMQETCPEAIAAYSDCVSKANEEGLLTRGACESEFRAVKACFKQARVEMRQG